MIRVGIIGGAGYTAGELIRLLVNHPQAEIAFVHSTSNAGNRLAQVHGGLEGDTGMRFCDAYDLGAIDVLFLCSAHGQSRVWMEENSIPAGVKIIDLAQDFRDESCGFVYGLPELNRERIRRAERVANPGCFATAIQLALLPLAAGIRPDLITTAKGMANGFPIGGVLIAPHFEARPGLLGTTFGGSHLACAAAIAVLEVIERDALVENAAEIGDYLLAELHKIGGLKEVRGRGLMIGIEIDGSGPELRKKLLFDKHIFTGGAGASTVRLLPALCLTKEMADRFLTAFDKVKGEK